jgi:hypothetical protein
MMRRLKLNFYRAEDMMFIMRKRQWEEEDREFAIEQKRRAKEKRERIVKKNKERRMRKEREGKMLEDERKVNEEREDKELQKAMVSLFKCPLCEVTMSPPKKIYQCVDGHILCKKCWKSEKVQVIFSKDGCQMTLYVTGLSKM